MAMTKAQANKKIRQDALREQLANQGHLQHVNDMLTKVMDLGQDLSGAELQRLKVAIDTKLSLIKKYLPDTSNVQLSGDEDAPLAVTTKIVLEALSDDS